MPEDMLYRSDIVRELAKFFLEEFSKDPGGVADWIAQGDLDFDEFHKLVSELAEEDPKANA